jgi:outer membrane protein
MKRISIALVLLLSAAAVASAQTPGGQRGTTPPPTSSGQRGTTPPAAPTTPTPPPTLSSPQAPAKPATPPPPFPEGAKVAFVNMQTIVGESKLGKQGQDEMKALHDKNAAALTAKQKTLQDVQQKIESQKGVLSESALQAMARDLDRQQRELQAMQQQYQADEQNKNDDLLNNFQEKVLPIIDALRVEKGLWVIFGVQAADGGGLLVASANEGLNLSFEVVKRLDAAAPGTGAGK